MGKGRQNTPGRYRPDIDGLRALAVLLVLLCHLRTRLTGGYVGVDVFFVISGYLITAHIVSALQGGGFSSLDFYERRIRRILPALLVMLAASCAAAYVLLLPTEAADFAHSLIAALFSFSNVLFYGQTGYFQAEVASKPLLHTWSLGVEEQFYFVFPLLMLLLWKFARRHLQAVLGAMLLLSFVAACWYVRHDPSAAFYLFPQRAWELLTGAVLSQKWLPPLRARWLRNVASLAGLGMVLAAAVVFHGGTAFPGLAALPVCLGAALIIAAGETGGSVVGSILSWKPVVFIGLISYSLYLWHWPLIVFGFLHAGEFGRNRKLGVFALSLVMATLSWALVERPFRAGRLRPGRKVLFIITGTGVAALFAVGLWMVSTGGMGFRFSPESNAMLQYPELHPNLGFRTGTCFISAPVPFQQYDREHCLGDATGKPQMLLLGDSLAAHLNEGLTHVFPEIDFSQLTSAGCTPLLAPDTNVAPMYLPNCQKMLALAFGDYLLTHRPAAVLLSGRWRAENLAALAETILWLKQHGQRVIVFGPVPEFDIDLPLALAMAARSSHPNATLAAYRTAGMSQLDQQMARLAAEQWKVEYISAFSDLCVGGATGHLESGDGCPVLVTPGVPLLLDRRHFSGPGSVLFAQAMRDRRQLP